MVKRDITSLDRELKEGALRAVYVVVGPESYLARSSVRLIQEAAGVGDPGSMNITTFTGREAKPERIFTALRTAPLLGGRPLVIVSEAERMGKGMVEALEQYLESPVESSTLILVAAKLDGRTRFMQLAAKRRTSSSISAMTAGMFGIRETRYCRASNLLSGR